MSERIDEFCRNLQTKLNEVEGRVNMLKTRLSSAPKEAQDALTRELDLAQKRLDAHKQSIEKARTSAGDWIEKKKSEAASAIDQWKANREAKKLAERADEAEEYAAAEIEIASASIEEAEQAVLEALIARLDANAVAV